MNKPINWNYISRAIDFYIGAGFKYVEVPWIVSSIALGATLPKHKKGYTTELGSLVGSAEQSFIELLIRNHDLNGNFVAATPCFRDDEEDELHQHYFFKVELFVKCANFDEALLDTQKLADLARDFFSTLGAKTSTIWTGTSLDVLLNDVEIGSYGPRGIGNHVWTYGTGIAEPRFSYAKSL